VKEDVVTWSVVRAGGGTKRKKVLKEMASTGFVEVVGIRGK
jgi:hypothetical protein